MRGKSYLSVGNVAMGIAGSIVDPDFLQEYLGIRAEQVDMTEVARRITLGIYDHEEYEKAMAWTEKILQATRRRGFQEPSRKEKRPARKRTLTGSSL